MIIGFPRFLLKRRRLWLAISGCGASVCLVIGWIGSEFFLTPKRRPLEPRHQAVIASPDDFGLSLSEDFSVTGSDGVSLRWQLISPSGIPGEAVKTRRMRQKLSSLGRRLPNWGEIRGTVVMLHGRGGIKEDAFPVAERIVAAGFHCLIYDARAHGESGGRFSTYGSREIADLKAVIDAAEAQYGREVLGPLVGFGISLGAAVTLQALPDEPRLIAAVVVAPFSELPAVMDQAVGNVISPRMPTILTRAVMLLGGARGEFSPGKIRPVESARRIAVPVMVVHGEKDGVIPIAQGKAVYAAITHPDKRWRPVPEGGHGNVLAVGGDDLYAEMILFWLDCLAKPQADATPELF